MIHRPSDRPAPLLSIQDLVTTIATDHGMVRAVNHISLDLYAGKSLGIVGESGSGKSILAKSILKLLPKNAHVSANSRICFDGLVLNQMSAKALNRVRGRRIAMIFQDPMMTLNPVLTIGTQMTETLLAHRKMSKDKAKEIALEKLKKVISNKIWEANRAR